MVTEGRGWVKECKGGEPVEWPIVRNVKLPKVDGDALCGVQ